MQLANLAIRNAWFSGGVEWNIGTTGHSPFTCSPLFASRVESRTGTPFLRLYEWERFRQTPFQIDAYLPERSRVLFIRPRIINPNPHTVPIYWWSNIAVPETEEARVVVPAHSVYCLGCRPGYLEIIKVPEHDGVDYTYSTRMNHAADFFFELENHGFPWIAALDRQGQGLVQLSTPELVGRKLWVWGKGPGGRNWQRFLSPPGRGYIEIQAGLTRTQLEHKPLPAGAACSWLEAYGFLEADPDLVHGEDWTRAVQHVDERVQGLKSPQALSREYLRGAEYEDQPPIEIFQIGSGWGALELRRREINSKREKQVRGLVFGDDSLTADQAPWVTLLENGAFPALEEKATPGSFVSVEGWGKLVEKTLEGQSADNWYAWYQAGNLRYHAGDLSAAEQAWKHSLDLEWSPWAARNLAQLAWKAGELNQAAELFIQACGAEPAVLPLVIECGKCLIPAGRIREWLQIFRKLPQSLRSVGRIRFLQAKAGLATGDLTIVEKYFNEQGIFSDLRERENAVSDLWVEYQVQKMIMEEDLSENDAQIIQFRENPPVPEEIDFRM
jgi:hypothetical protein